MNPAVPAMKSTRKPNQIVAAMTPVLAFLLLSGTAAAQPVGDPLKEGATFQLGPRRATLAKLDSLPHAETEYTRRFKFDSFDNPKLAELRTRHALDQVVAPGKDEFDRQVLLMDWTHNRFTKFGRPTTTSRGALEVLDAVREDKPFFCTQYAQVMVSAAASLGWVDRALALRRHQGNAKDGSSEHTTTEIWSNQHRKWIMLDPTANMYLEKDGVPLNAYEIRQEWFYRGGTNLVFVVGKERRKYRRTDLPVFLKRFPGFGDLVVNPDELDKYGFTGFIPNTDFMDAREDYGRMFIVKDALCDGTSWHTRTVPENPAVDPYFPLGQSSLRLTVDGAVLRVSVATMTPNLKKYQARMDRGEWKPVSADFSWSVRPGSNRLEVRTINRFGVEGPISTAELQIIQ